MSNALQLTTSACSCSCACVSECVCVCVHVCKEHVCKVACVHENFSDVVWSSVVLCCDFGGVWSAPHSIFNARTGFSTSRLRYFFFHLPHADRIILDKDLHFLSSFN